jgi:hypothetical protein
MSLLENFLVQTILHLKKSKKVNLVTHTENATSIDEKFIYNFKKNGGKFCIVKTKKKSKNNLKTY